MGCRCATWSVPTGCSRSPGMATSSHASNRVAREGYPGHVGRLERPPFLKPLSTVCDFFGHLTH